MKIERRDYVDFTGVNWYKNRIAPQTPRAAQLTIKFEF